ncbi:unnamed protein product [Anisakis simplex]|uniref:Testis-specific protein pbs13-related (inferred by orthology to a S. mansoni protein) n=1 Tax=Anisakis simplex TaxID=6269 RepID=A0A0M3J4G8_ANISI|nr:unnamed protein product [Anisakis simplex]
MFPVDRNRLEAIAEKVLQLIVCTSCVLITCNLAGKEVCEFDNFKGNLKNQLVIITNDIEKSNINERLELVYAQCEKGILSCYKELNLGDYDDEKKAQLRAQIMAVSEPNNQVRKLMQNRINSFILSMISHESASTSQRLPIGVSMVEQELTAVLSLLTRIISHNRTTFGTLYGELIKEAMSN